MVAFAQVKTVETPGQGWKKPEKDGACLVKFVGKLADGTECYRFPPASG